MTRRGYHHGNLREALIGAALELIGEKGVFGFTFADAARHAGVSPAAPYRHFRDRDELMADVARQGFERLEQTLLASWNEGRPDPLAALGNLGRTYLAFARDEPAHYAAMFESTLPHETYTELAEASHRTFTVLRRAADAACALLPAPGRPPALMLALHLWSLSHGVAALFGRGDAARRRLPMPPEDLLEAGLLVYLEGLGFSRPRHVA